MDLIKPNWHWKGALIPISKEAIDGIALHHMAHKTADIWEIEKWHHANGWAGIGYNFWIDKKGNIYQARGFNLAAGVKGENSHLLSIGFQGDYDNEYEMPIEQITAGQKLISWLIPQLPNLKTIAGHKHWNDTSCPGAFFPISIFDTMSILKKYSTGERVVELQIKLNKLGYDLIVDGDFGTETDTAVKHFQSSMSLEIDGIVGPVTSEKLNEMVNKLRSGVIVENEINIDKAIDILFNEKVISDKNYWKNAIEYQINVQQLLINMAKRITNQG